jgi:hypothetical protein
LRYRYVLISVLKTTKFAPKKSLASTI